MNAHVVETVVTLGRLTEPKCREILWLLPVIREIDRVDTQGSADYTLPSFKITRPLKALLRREKYG